MTKTPLLEMRGITKSFGETRALQGVDIDLLPGEVHAIVGENGAGKSTLGRCLAGLYSRYGGTVTIEGQVHRITTPDQAKAAGVAMVHQELYQIPYLSAAENIFLGTEVGALRFGLINRRAQTGAAAKALQGLRTNLDPSGLVIELSVANRQIIEIAKALARKPRVLVLDEPTSALSSTETEALLEIVRSLRNNGLAIAYISHRLEEIFSIADRVTVLRDGQLIKTIPVVELTPDDLVRLMVGRGVSELYHPPTNATGSAILSVNGLTRRGEFHDISFEVHKGEILGLAGLIGAGRTQVAESIFGLRKLDQGVIEVGGARVQIRSPSDAISHGIYLVPEDRRGKGLIPWRSIRENLTLPLLQQFCKGEVVFRANETQVTDRIIQNMRIRCRNREQSVGGLSGGNQQKIVVGKWLIGQPRILILDEPTRGIDIAAKADLHATIRQLAAEGVGILLISSELPEVVGACHRVLVLREGKMVASLPRPEITEQKIMSFATGATVSVEQGMT